MSEKTTVFVVRNVTHDHLATETRFATREQAKKWMNRVCTPDRGTGAMRYEVQEEDGWAS